MFSLVDYFVSLLARAEDSPLRDLKQWSPFRIDALGLVTLLGAEEVNKTIGTLRKRNYTDWLPLLAAFVVAGDHFTEERPGYSLYNITDGVHTTELKGWFGRWLSVQKLRNSTTIFRWSIHPERKPSLWEKSAAPGIAFLAVAPLLICTCLIGDWFGIGNSLAITVSVLVRKFMIWQRRMALDTAAAPEKPVQLPLHATPSEKSDQSVDSFTKQLHRETSQPSLDETVTLLVTRADGKLATIYAPRSVLSTFVRDVSLSSQRLYGLARWTGWAAFGAHIVLIGMSSLFAQIYTVVLLVLSTWLLCHGFAADIGNQSSERAALDGTTSEITATAFTSRLSVEQENPATQSLQGRHMDRRMHAYVRLQPTAKQEKMLRHWSLQPFEEVPWYKLYDQAKEEYARQQQAARSPVVDHSLRPAQAEV